MSRARHRLTGIRHDETSHQALDLDIIHNPYYQGFVQWYPTEDTTLYNVKGDLGSVSDYSSYGGGGTGSTSATYVIDQSIHQDLAGSSSENLVHIGAAYDLFVGSGSNALIDYSWYFNPDDYIFDVGSTGWLHTPARRTAMVFSSSDWGQWGVGVTPGLTSGGVTSGDIIMSATMHLHTNTMSGHVGNSGNPNSHGGQQQNRPPPHLLSSDITINVDRICRGASNDGASNGITSGSMINTAWWTYKGGDTLAAYWGGSGAASGGATSTVYGDNSQDLDQTNRASFTQTAESSSQVVSFDVTELVRDAMTSRTGDLRLFFRYDRDIDGSTTGYGHADDFVYTYWNNMTSYYSKDHPDPSKRPRIDIHFARLIQP